jgi:hypothetical protein
MIRTIPVPNCASCPYRQFHYGSHECSKMEFKQLPKQEVSNGKHPTIPSWCPLPPHPTANE